MPQPLPEQFPRTPRTPAQILRSRSCALAALAIALCAGCTWFSSTPSNTLADPDLVVADLDPLPHPAGAALDFRAAQNEWLDAFLLITPSPKPRFLRLKNSTLPPDLDLRAYRVESVPIDTRSVDSVRDAGPGLPAADLPSALVPLERPRENTFRVPPNTSLLYIELRAPINTPPGQYHATLALSDHPGAGLPLALTLDDVALSDAPEFAACGTVSFSDLARLFPSDLGATPPLALTRGESSDVLAVERLDSLVRLARDNRLNLAFLGLAPTIKNTPREGLRVDWSTYDSLVLPWLTGDFDRSGNVLTALPLPIPDALTTGAITPRDYLANAVSHFDQNHAADQLLLPPPLRPTDLPNNDAARRARLALPSTLTSTLTPHAIRALAWEAFAAHAQTILLGDVSPAPTTVHATWFYPGQPFGAAGVIPAIGAKRARRAVQDYQLFELAQQRGAGPLAQTIAAKATHHAPPSAPDTADLLTPSVSHQTWDAGLALVRSAMVTRPPGGPPPDPQTLAEESDALARWSAPLDAAPILPLATEYAPDGAVRATFWLPDPAAQLTLVHAPAAWSNPTLTPPAASDPPPNAPAPPAPSPQARGALPVLSPPHAALRSLTAHLDPALVTSTTSTNTLRLRSQSGPDRIEATLTAVLPTALVAPSQGPITLDGSLAEWSASESIHTGGLTRMSDRSSAQSGTPATSVKPTEILARWDDAALYLAFRADNVGAQPAIALNTLTVSQGRATEQDLLRLTLLPTAHAPIRLTLTPRSTHPDTPGAESITAASTLDAGTWRCELRIPASLLGPLHPGDRLPFNLTRHDAATGESSSWSGPLNRDDQPWTGLLILK